MGLVRSHVFIAWALGPQSATVPTGKIWLVKYAVWHNPAGTGTTAVLQVTPPGGAAFQVYRAALAAEGTAALPVPITLDAGWGITLTYGAGTTTKVHASGIQFTP